MEKAVKNVQLTIPTKLLERVDTYCEENYLKRSTVFAQGVNLLLVQQNIPVYLKRLCDAMEKIAQSNTITDEQKQELETLSKFADMLGGNVMQ